MKIPGIKFLHILFKLKLFIIQTNKNIKRKLYYVVHSDQTFLK